MTGSLVSDTSSVSALRGERFGRGPFLKRGTSPMNAALYGIEWRFCWERCPASNGTSPEERGLETGGINGCMSKGRSRYGCKTLQVCKKWRPLKKSSCKN